MMVHNQDITVSKNDDLRILAEETQFSVLHCSKSKSMFSLDGSVTQPIMTIDHSGIVTWHKQAKEMLDNDELWNNEYTKASRAIMRLLFEREEKVKLIEEALFWYQQEAQAAHQNLKVHRDQALLAILNVLSLDNGNRAKRAIEILKGERTS